MYDWGWESQANTGETFGQPFDEWDSIASNGDSLMLASKPSLYDPAVLYADGVSYIMP